VVSIHFISEFLSSYNISSFTESQSTCIQYSITRTPKPNHPLQTRETSRPFIKTLQRPRRVPVLPSRLTTGHRPRQSRLIATIPARIPRGLSTRGARSSSSVPGREGRFRWRTCAGASCEIRRRRGGAGVAGGGGSGRWRVRMRLDRSDSGLSFFPCLQVLINVGNQSYKTD
jgi:hypothetical protein